MFKCNNCGKSSKPGERPIKRTVESREVVYNNRVKKVDDDDAVTIREFDTNGHEIVKEVSICAKCAK